MKRTQLAMQRAAARLTVAIVGIVGIVVASGLPAHAVNTCFTYTPGHVYYVAYQNNPAGPEYVVDLGDRNIFLNATTTLTFPDIRAADFATLFSSSAPNLWVGLFGVRNTDTRDGIVSANGPKDQFQLDNSSPIGAAQQIDSWATGINQFGYDIGGPPCSLNAASFPGKVFGSYQYTLNGLSQGSVSGNLVWNVESRLSSSSGLRSQTNKIRFNSGISNPSTGSSARSSVGYFVVYTNGTAQFWPDDDGDLLPDVAVGSDPEADKCLGVNSTDNTDVDGDNHAVACDCNDASATVWAIPTEISGLGFSTKTDFTWSVPVDVGATTAIYDVFRGQQASPGTNPVYSCFAPNLASPNTTDPTTPTPGALPYLYLARARTSCGGGSVGQGRNGPVRNVPPCP